MWELDYKESWVLKNWCFWTVVLEKTLESPLDCKETKPVHPKGNQSWLFIGRTGAEAETPILGPLDAKNWLIWKGPDTGKGWRWEEKGMREDEMVWRHHRLNGHEFESTLGVGDGQGSLACCSPWGHLELYMTELIWTSIIIIFMYFSIFRFCILYCGLPQWLSGKEAACNAADVGEGLLIPGWERSPGWGNGNPFQYSCLENPMDRGAWRATV